MLSADAPTLLSAEIVNVNDCATVGVPDRTPVVASSTSPSGTCPALTVYAGAGVPVAVKVNEYASPTVAGDGGVAEVNVGLDEIFVVCSCEADPPTLVAVTV